MILYEYPFNESIRTFLRLEQLFKRLVLLVSRDSPTDHHFALVTLFEVMDVAGRSDVKTDLMRELDRAKAQFEGYRGNPAIQEGVLDQFIGRIDAAWQGLQAMQGRCGQALQSNDWLMAIRSRIGIPGGTCEFDLPSYFAWQHENVDKRQADLQTWIQTMAPLYQALVLVLNLLRDSGMPHMVAAPGGQFVQPMKEGRTYQLLRVRLDPAWGLIPEISGNRLLVSIRLMRPDAEGKLRLATDVDGGFELTLCA